MSSASNRSTAKICALLVGTVIFGGTLGWLKSKPRDKDSVTGQTAAVEQSPAPPRPVPTPARGPVATLKAEPVIHAASADPVSYPQAPAFAEVKEGNFEARTPRYRALLNAGEGLRYQAQPPAAFEFHVRLSRVARGEKVIFDRATDPDASSDTAVDDGAGALSFWRAPGFEEHYIPRGDGIEQNFTFDEPLAGTGDLVFSSDISLRGLTPAEHSALRGGGISFNLAGTTHAALRYGLVVVRDSAAHGMVIEPALSGKSIRFAVPDSFLKSAVFPLTVDPLIGNEFFITPESATNVKAPAVAAGGNNFLVAWHDSSAGHAPRLMGSLVTQTAMVSAPFAISAAIGVPQPLQSGRNQIAFDGSSNWLVVWSDDRPVAPGVRGAIIGTNGAILGGSDFLIATTPGTIPEAPLATYNGTDFVVAWMSAPAGSKKSGSQIYFARVSPSGTVLPAKAIPPQAAPEQTALLLSGQKPRGDALLVYREASATRCARIAADGTLRDANPIALNFDGAETPAGAQFVDDGWQILSTVPHTGVVRVHKLSQAGVLNPTAQTLLECHTPEPLTVSAGASGWTFLNSEPLAENASHILGRRAGFDGAVFDSIPFQVDDAESRVSDAACSQADDQILTVWMDTRGAAQRIVAALNSVTVTGNAGPGVMPVVFTSPANGSAPVAVNFDATGSTGNYDALQWNFGDGTTSTQPIVSHTYRVNGTYIAQLQLTRGAHNFVQTVEVSIGAASEQAATPHIGTPAESSADMARGSFLISKFTCQEQGADKHTFSIKGQLARPAGGQYQLAADGHVELSIGTHIISFPVGRFVAQNGSIKFSGKPGSSGLKKFSINQRSGVFDLQLVNIPAKGKNGSGLLLSGDHATNVDLNLSVKFNLKDGPLNAGRYIYITRKDARSRGWKLR